MMRKLTLLSVGMLLFGITSFAQSINPCGFDALHKEKMRTDRRYEHSVRELNNRWVRHSKMMASSMLTYTPAGYVYEIPMVIHVIHTGGAVGTKYNPDSTRIAEMIAHMNKNYAAEAPFPDTTSGGSRIPLKFVLAKRTPAGASTNGIVRIDGTTAFTAYDGDGVKRSGTAGITTAEAMGLSRWSPSDYYNVYIVNKIDGNDLYTTGGVAGFAYFPGFPAVDGMVVVASQVSDASTTVAHEFGHAFGLYHTFEGDGNSPTCPPNADCTIDGDMVCDTEPHWASSHYSPVWCPPSDVNPCTFSSYNNVQHNIMDYTQCPPDRFTAGQRDRVLNTLNYERTGYKFSAGLLPPSGTVTTACIPTSSGVTANVGPVIVDFNGSKVWTGDMNREERAYVDHSYTQQNYVKKGASYKMSVTTDVNQQKVKAYIDYNNDGDFADAGEEVFSSIGTGFGEEVHSGTITIPATATTCAWLRMRVVAALSSATITDMACGPYANDAQAEDYAVYVKNPIAADSVTIAQTAGANPACSGEIVTFSATVKSGKPKYNWFVNGVEASGKINDSFYSSIAFKNDDVITCMIYYTGACGADSIESNAIQIKVSTTALAVVKNTLLKGSNPGCAGQALVFKATVGGGGPSPVYSWKLNGTDVGGNFDTFATNTLVAGDRVWCNVTPNSSCSTTPVNSDTITISFAPVIPGGSIVLTSGSIPSCDSTSLIFAAAVTNGGPAPKYQWYVNNVAVPGATGISYTGSLFKNNDSVWCRIISNHACIVPTIGDTAWSNRIIIIRNTRVTPSFAVNITRGTNPGCLDSLLEFTATASDGGGSPLVVWYINGAIASYGTVFGSTSFSNGDVLTSKMFMTPGSCNTVDSLGWGPVVISRAPTPAAPVISLIGTFLVSSIPAGIQWYGPDGLIPGATGPTHHPAKEGNYYAILVHPDCSSAPSNILNVSLLSISPYNMSELKIYPNPTSGMLTLEWNADRMTGNIDVFTMSGQRIASVVVEQQQTQTIDLTSFANGNYFIVIRDHSGKTGTVPVTVKH